MAGGGVLNDPGWNTTPIAIIAFPVLHFPPHTPPPKPKPRAKTGVPASRRPLAPSSPPLAKGSMLRDIEENRRSPTNLFRRFERDRQVCWA